MEGQGPSHPAHSLFADSGDPVAPAINGPDANISSTSTRTGGKTEYMCRANYQGREWPGPCVFKWCTVVSTC